MTTQATKAALKTALAKVQPDQVNDLKDGYYAASDGLAILSAALDEVKGTDPRFDAMLTLIEKLENELSSTGLGAVL